jgi:hypothetical protein
LLDHTCTICGFGWLLWEEPLRTDTRDHHPLVARVAKFKNQRFEPMGMTDDPDIPRAMSVGDYLARRLAHDWLDVDARAELDLLTSDEEAALPADAYAPTPLHRPARAARP